MLERSWDIHDEPIDLEIVAFHLMAQKFGRIMTLTSPPLYKPARIDIGCAPLTNNTPRDRARRTAPGHRARESDLRKHDDDRIRRRGTRAGSGVDQTRVHPIDTGPARGAGPRSVQQGSSGFRADRIGQDRRLRDRAGSQPGEKATGASSAAGAPAALIVALTRELALQVKRELEWLYEMTGASLASCVGGMDMRNERRALERSADIVVSTPGRLRDHIERGSLDTGALKAVVLDEADEMLDLGFREDLEFIWDAAPPEQRIPDVLRDRAKLDRDTCQTLSEERGTPYHSRGTGAAPRHQYQALLAAPSDHENAIINVLRHTDARSAIVFCATRATVNQSTQPFHQPGLLGSCAIRRVETERTHPRAPVPAERAGPDLHRDRCRGPGH